METVLNQRGQQPFMSNRSQRDQTLNEINQLLSNFKQGDNDVVKKLQSQNDRLQAENGKLRQARHGYKSDIVKLEK